MKKQFSSCDITLPGNIPDELSRIPAIDSAKCFARALGVRYEEMMQATLKERPL